MTIEELEAKLETVTRERDEALTEIAEWKRVTGYDDTETLDFECGRAGIRTHIDVNLRLRETANRERDEARAEVERLRVKAEAYGGMVDGCGPALEAAGHPIDPFQPDGRVGGIARSVAALIKERDEARAEVEHAYREGGALYEAKIAEREAFRCGAEAMRARCEEIARHACSVIGKLEHTYGIMTQGHIETVSRLILEADIPEET